MNDDAIRQVRELLTPCPPKAIWTDTRANPTSSARTPAQLDPSRMGKTFRATPRRSGADAYGWTYEHLQALIGDEVATDAMCTFLNHTLGGRISEETIKDMKMVKATPLLKESEGKVRPTTVGSTLHK